MRANEAVELDKLELAFLDVQSEEYIADPFGTIARARAQDPRGGRLLRSVYGVEVVDYDLGRELLTDKKIVTPHAKHYRERGAGPLLLKFMEEGKLTAQQGKQHLLHRRVLNTRLTPQSVKAQRELYFQVANRLTDGFIKKGKCELISEFTHPYPIEILCRAFEIDVEDIPIFDSVARDLPFLNAVPLTPYVEAIENSLKVLSEYTASLVDQPAPQRKGFIAELAEHIEVETLTRDEIVWSLVTLLQAAHYTTRNQIASVVRALIENNVWDEVAQDVSLIPAAVEEGMRYYPVVLSIARVVNEPDYVIDGVELPEGTVVRFNMIGSSRDPNRFENPDKFDIYRNVGRRIPFGYGAHKCLGHAMARSDMEVALEVLMKRLKNPRITATFTPEAVGSVWGPGALHLEFES